MRDRTPTDALFVGSDSHKTPVSCLAGRNLYVGTSTFLYFHGFDNGPRIAQEKEMLGNPANLARISREIGVDYVYWSSFERTMFPQGEQALKGQPVVFRDGDVSVYALSERARKATPAL
jgi:hypothetical protein